LVGSSSPSVNGANVNERPPTIRSPFSRRSRHRLREYSTRFRSRWSTSVSDIHLALISTTLTRHTEFILCLGHRGEVIQAVLPELHECSSNDFRLTGATGRALRPRYRNGKITVRRTASTRTSLNPQGVQRYIADDESFSRLSDGLTDLPLDDYLEHFQMRDRSGSFVCVHPSHSFHALSVPADGRRAGTLRPAVDSNLWINGGFSPFKRRDF